MQLVINRHDNQEQNIKTRISQGLPIFSILFLVYISRVFEKVIKSCLKITSLLLVDDLSFIVFRYSVKKLNKIPEQVAIIILNKKKSNTIIYNLAKIEVVLFFKSH